MNCPTKLAAGLSFERTPDGPRLVVSREIGAAPAVAWRLLTDTHRWPVWGPSVVGVACEGRFVQAGTCGHVRTVGGLELPFRVTECADRRWTWRVAGVPATGHRVEPLESGCRVAFEIPPLAAPYALVCRRGLATIERLARDATE
ncbi:SRPBCC family protein [Halococcus agarilyticus]|uniref:SRPBCC family protein n=1 Tax=Halococcus agarilyticus TaxID=1232219 RepID=UPI000677F01A|nr:SRPBCC family protein [Halococcus agarilyticus]